MACAAALPAGHSGYLVASTSSIAWRDRRRGRSCPCPGWVKLLPDSLAILVACAAALVPGPEQAELRRSGTLPAVFFRAWRETWALRRCPDIQSEADTAADPRRCVCADIGHLASSVARAAQNLIRGNFLTRERLRGLAHRYPKLSCPGGSGAPPGSPACVATHNAGSVQRPRQ